MLRLRRNDVVLTHSDVLRLRRKVMWCVPYSRAKRTSLPKETSRTKCASRSAQAEHIVQKKNICLGRQMFFFCCLWRTKRLSSPYFAFGENSLAFRLTSELVDLRAANANPRVLAHKLISSHRALIPFSASTCLFLPNFAHFRPVFQDLLSKSPQNW